MDLSGIRRVKRHGKSYYVIPIAYKLWTITFPMMVIPSGSPKSLFTTGTLDYICSYDVIQANYDVENNVTC